MRLLRYTWAACEAFYIVVLICAVLPWVIAWKCAAYIVDGRWGKDKEPWE